MAVTIVTVAEHHYEYRGVHRTSQEEFVLELRQVYRGVHRTSQEEFVLELRQVYRGVHRTSQEEFVLELRQVYRGVHRTSQEEFVLELRQVYREVHQYFSKTGGTRSLHRRGPGIQGVCCADVSDDHALRGLPMLLEGDATVWWRGARSHLEGRRAPTSLHVDSETKIRKLLGGCGASMDFNCVLVHYPYTDPFSDSQEFDFSSLSDAEAGIQDIT
ncbi:uncharacterized protein LOC126911334 isoform X1 [Spodoptera frugiperda]|uniref:Uncharacterized protein LOC126911334 isoform X1 n=1 Tax=Spodoptera frugiperda TaxID=7108 RepID=A0A9R0EYC7_SPOFR|nr:uncharacterized protein LOC126911334 isoform X1 [Spodoptera frugiperda]